MLEIFYVEACVKVKRTKHTQRIELNSTELTRDDAHKMARQLRHKLETEYPNWTDSEHKVSYSQYNNREG